MHFKSSKRRGLSLIGLVPLALLIAACGSSAKSGGSAAKSAAGAGTSLSASPASSSMTLSVRTGSAGTYLVGSTGHALYLWEADMKNKSNCSTACLSVWPAVTASGKPTAGTGVNASAIGTIKTDGATQITYDGHPLYYYAPDSSATSTLGQGSDGFGAKWWLVSPAGQAITGHNSSSATSSSGSTGY